MTDYSFWVVSFWSISVLHLYLSSNWANSIRKDNRLATLASSLGILVHFSYLLVLWAFFLTLFMWFWCMWFKCTSLIQVTHWVLFYLKNKENLRELIVMVFKYFKTFQCFNFFRDTLFIFMQLSELANRLLSPFMY